MSIVITSGCINDLLGLYILIGENKISSIVIQTTEEYLDQTTKNICALLACTEVNIPLYYYLVDDMSFTDNDIKVFNYLNNKINSIHEYFIRNADKLANANLSGIAFGCDKTVQFLIRQNTLSSVVILNPEYKLISKIPIKEFYSSKFPQDIMLKSRMIVMSSNFLHQMIPNKDDLIALSNNNFSGISFALYVTGLYPI